MAVIDKLKLLGIDVHDQVSVIRVINGLAISDTQKTEMARQYLDEMDYTLSLEARRAASFPT